MADADRRVKDDWLSFVGISVLSNGFRSRTDYCVNNEIQRDSSYFCLYLLGERE